MGDEECLLASKKSAQESKKEPSNKGGQLWDDLGRRGGLSPADTEEMRAKELRMGYWLSTLDVLTGVVGTEHVD